jgi:hypothetical protein
LDDKTFNPPLYGQKSITILCLDDECKKKKEGEFMHLEKSGEGQSEAENL